MTNTQNCFIEIIRAVICDYPLPSDFTVEDERSLFDLAKYHDMAHILGFAIYRSRQDLDLLTKAKILLEPTVVPAEQ